MTPGKALSLIEKEMDRVSKLTTAIGENFGSHPAVYALNESWHKLGEAHAAMEQTCQSSEQTGRN